MRSVAEDGGGRLPMMAKMAALAWLERYRNGDSAAAGELIAQVQPGISRIIRRHLPRRDAQEDLVQEVLAKIFARLHQYNGTAPFTHWAARIALYTCFDHLRAQRRRAELRVADLTAAEAAGIDNGVIDERSVAPVDGLTTREINHYLLERLRPIDRAVVIEFYFDQKSVAEIGASHHWKIEFVKMRLFRARRKLRRVHSALPRWDQ